ncbi:DUF5719 family protein [Brachybacterium sp. AOP43-C2-M15]|uniref:DUF5719 family protein n=1 Tax=Brachybacterium sp. AOP43-C2-M15 TaxID=3457661 RepID=UPI00403341A2
MAENPAPEGTGDHRARRDGARPLLALAALLPLALAAGALLTVPEAGTVAVDRASAVSQPGASTRWCHGPLQVPEGALDAGADPELAVAPPSPEISLRTVSVEPASSLLFGTVSGSSTLQEEDGSVRAPSITVDGPDGGVLSDSPSSQDLGAAVLGMTGLETAPHVSSATSEQGRPIADTLQSTVAADGDYRSLAVTRCAEPATEASFLGTSTATGDSSVLVLQNTTDRPATASVQLWTEDGPAAMDGRSQIVVAPGEEERVLLESVAAGHEAVGVDVSVLGAPLVMHLQTTERDGLTPGGAEILDPLPAAGTDLLMPGVDVAGTAPTLVLANPRGTDTTASVEVVGPDGPIDAAALAEVDVPGGTVVRTSLDGLPEGTYSVRVRAEEPVTAVARSALTGAELPGDTIGAPVDLAVVAPAPAIRSHGMSALPAQGAAGELTLAATADSAVTVIPIAADGSAGEPLEVEVAAGATAAVGAQQLEIDGESAAGISLVPEVPGVVHAAWTQRQSDGDEVSLLSSYPVLSEQGGGRDVTVTLGE